MIEPAEINCHDATPFSSQGRAAAAATASMVDIFIDFLASRFRSVLAQIRVDALDDALAGMSLGPLSAWQLKKDPHTDHGRIREADAADARNSPFLSATYGRCISDGESRQ